MVVQLINSLVPLGDRRASFSASYPSPLQNIHPPEKDGKMAREKFPLLIGETRRYTPED